MRDIFLTNNKSLFSDVKSIPSVSFDADRRLVIATLKVNNPTYEERVKTRKYKHEKLNRPEIANRMKEVVEHKLQLDDGVLNNVELMWNEFRTRIIEATVEVLGKKEH